MIGLKRLLWGLQNVSSWVVEAKNVAAIADAASKARTDLQTNVGQASRASDSANRSSRSSKNRGAAEGVSLNSEAGKWYVGHQFRFFTQEKDGSFSVTKPSWINLYYTEGRSFRLTGQVLLAHESLEEDQPHGFALFLREFDSRHRYEASSSGIRLKRRLIEGSSREEFGLPFECEGIGLEAWHSFSVEVGLGSIVVKFGDQTATVTGPLDSEGANKIALCPGARLNDLRITLLD